MIRFSRYLSALFLIQVLHCRRPEFHNFLHILGYPSVFELYRLCIIFQKLQNAFKSLQTTNSSDQSSQGVGCSYHPTYTICIRAVSNPILEASKGWEERCRTTCAYLQGLFSRAWLLTWHGQMLCAIAAATTASVGWQLYDSHRRLYLKNMPLGPDSLPGFLCMLAIIDCYQQDFG